MTEMHELNDHLLDQLRALDPVDPDELPSADESNPQRLVEMIMNNKPISDDGPAPGSRGFEAAPANDFGPPPPAAAGRSKRGLRRGAILLGTAAAIMVLFAGVLVFLPQNTTPALAAVKNAAQATATADSGRVGVTFSMEGTDGTENAESENVAGTVDGSFTGDDVAFSLDVSQLSSGLAHEAPPVTETRLVDGMLYVNNNGAWISMEAPAILASTITDVVDPRSVLTQVQELVQTDEVGSVTIENPAGATVETTHFQSVVDPGDESLGQTGWMPGAEMGAMLADLDADGEIIVDLYVDDNGLLRQLDVSGDLQEPDGGAGTATFSVSTSFFDLGADIVIQAPVDAEAVDFGNFGIGDENEEEGY